MTMLRFVVLLCLLGLALSGPPVGKSREEIDAFQKYLESGRTNNGVRLEDRMAENPNGKAWENSGKYQGDIILDEDQVQAMVNDFSAGRNAYTWPNTKWPQNTVVYEIAAGHFTTAAQNAIIAGIRDIERNTCIRFRLRQWYDTNYVRVTYPANLVSNLGLPYDYASTMHYGGYGFSINGRPTMVALWDTAGVMGQQQWISAWDWQRVNRHYNCAGAWNRDAPVDDSAPGQLIKSSTYLSHVRLQHPAMNVACDACGETFIASVKPESKCASCGLQFLSQDALARHAAAGCDPDLSKDDSACAWTLRDRCSGGHSRVTNKADKFKNLAAQSPDHPEMYSGKYQGDIVLDKEDVDDMVAQYASGRNAVIFPGLSTQWPDNTVIWTFADTHYEEPGQKEAVLEAMKLIESKTCVKFRQAEPSDRFFVNMTSYPFGCYAHVGYRVWRGPHIFNLGSTPGSDCYRQPTIVHELMHIMGFFHMHATYDRDNYVRVNYENIVSVGNLGVEYDYEIDGVMGQREYITEKDWLRINRYHNCPGAWE
ncbi:hypothetical protein MSG28_000165 [Choristoneura fumiferana]|uniref:Uncharacterized protein n=1 Tax=Choristoneura fumiferana TaxID=7141 RepID=A0ACC0JZZ4_CHOFU|nr:hypothetical protein MSG28_000165 [Choristoneura fumiferana]